MAAVRLKIDLDGCRAHVLADQHMLVYGTVPEFLDGTLQVNFGRLESPDVVFELLEVSRLVLEKGYIQDGDDGRDPVELYEFVPDLLEPHE